MMTTGCYINWSSGTFCVLPNNRLYNISCKCDRSRYSMCASEKVVWNVCIIILVFDQVAIYHNRLITCNAMITINNRCVLYTYIKLELP